MANNPYVNKVVYGNTTLIDISDTTATADKILQGYTAYGASGQKLTGTATGESIFAVEVIQDFEDDEKWKPDKTFAEIQSAYASGKQIIVYSSSNADVGFDLWPLGGFFASPYLGYSVYYTNEEYELWVEDNYRYDSNGLSLTRRTKTYAGFSEHTSSDLQVSGPTVTAPFGVYLDNASATVASGTAGTPSASKGSVSNHSIEVTPSVTNTTGYITGGTLTGSSVTVTASELASGNKAITENGTGIDVVGYSTVSVDVQSGTAAISVVDTTDSHGGTIREITALDISDTTAVASDVAQGKYFYTAAGVKTAGTGSGGSGGSKQEKTGTITGNGTNVIQISCDFEPQEIYIRGDLTGDATLRGIVSFTLIKDRELVITQDSSTSGTPDNAWIIKTITGYNEEYSSTEPYASYSNGTLTINTVVNSGSARWTSGISYSYSLVTYESVAADHVIHLEFSDSTDTDINVYYNDALLSTMITNYAPSTWTYSSKQVVLAQLDNTTWYEYSAIPLNTELVDYTKVTPDYNLDEYGEIKEAQWYGVTDYTPIDSEMVFSYKANMWAYTAFYDSSKAFLSSFQPYIRGESADPSDSNVAVGTLGGTGIAIPSTAAYIRMSTMANPNNTDCSLIRTA